MTASVLLMPAWRCGRVRSFVGFDKVNKDNETILAGVLKYIHSSTGLAVLFYLTGIVASRDLIPVASSGGNITTVWSAIVDASVILTSGCAATCASWCIAGHVRLNALIGASFISSTGTERAAWWTTVRPIFLLQLIITAWIRINIPGTAEGSTSGFHGTNTAETFTVHLSHACLNQG